MKSILPRRQWVGQVYQLIAAILHLGNIQFAEDPNNSQDAAIVKNLDTLALAADLLGVDANSLLSTLTFKSKMIKRDITTLFLDPAQASKQRDELAQSLYSLLFTWLVEQINDRLAPKNAHSFIGLVDSSGWLYSKPAGHNFDQFAFHFIQEKLHQFMLNSIFERDRQEYANEGITPASVSTAVWPSNASTISLFTHPSRGLYSIMNSQASRQYYQQQLSNEDEALMDNYTSANKTAINDQILSFVKSDTGARMFGIQHFWGSVSYNPQQFSERNQDYLCNDFIALFHGNAYNPSTTNALVAHIFDEKLLGSDDGTRNRVISQQQGIRPLRAPTVMTSGQQANIQTDQKADDAISTAAESLNSHVPSIADLVASGISDLTHALSLTQAWFVFCFRPNDLSLPNSCDVKKIAGQNSSFEILNILRHIKAVNYTASFTIEDFWDRYHISIPLTINTVPDANLSIKDKCIFIAQTMSWDESWMVVGETKVYLSNYAFRILEDDLRSLEKSESKKSKISSSVHSNPLAGQKFYDAYSFNEDIMSSAASDDDFISEACLHEYNNSEVFSQATLDGKKSSSLLLHGGHQHSSFQEKQNRDAERVDKADGRKSSEQAEKELEPPMSSVRRRWLIFVWFLTWWVPSPALNHCGGMKRRDVRLAWREKVALCLLIFFLSACMVVFIVFFGPLICPHQDVFSFSELQGRSEKDNAYVAIRGEVFDLTKFAPHHWASEVIPDSAIFDYAGKDATNLFPVQVSALCDGTTGRIPEELVLDYQVNLTDRNAAYHDFRFFTNDYRPDWYFEQMVYLRKNYRLGFMGYEPSDILRQATNVVNVGDVSTHRSWAILHGDVYDLTNYLLGGRAPRAPEGMSPPSNLDINFMDNSIVQLFRQLAGTDISKHFDALPISEDLRTRQLVCLRNLFFVGKVDTRRSIQCLFSEYFLLIVTGFLCAVILFKFLAALQLGTNREPENYDKFIICQVPCYTESEESLKKTIDSIAVLRYDDKRKLLFLVCDGMIVGSGNDRPTPRIVLDILGVESTVDPEPLSFLSLGEGIKQHNMAKIYSGLYECAGHVVPYLVVVKVGAPNERQKPGNRGKRDSQMVLMRFLNKVHFESPMTPMELEIYHQIKNVIGVNPSFYEFVLMVDADTEVLPDSLNRMVSCFVHDSKIVGLCGETKLANEKDSWVTMVQVYEYYISHFLSKAFESLFGSVTCLPGCFCMYRVRSPGKNQPLLVSNQVIEDYAENKVNTLHQKNLLHLGEDRYLTTLILKYFPTYKTKFTADAGCLTNAPDRWSVLLSQRRRWINSTIHNLGELVFLPQLCGFCCFSMRFVVILDLLSTLVMPAVVCYLGFLIYRLIVNADQVPFISIITLCGVYGLQAIIFIIRRKWEHIGWMIVYILAIPLFSFFIPMYAFWHFDDFSWGNTRVVLGDDGSKKVLPTDEGNFDPKSIPLKKWSDHENELWETGSAETKGTTITSSTIRRTANGLTSSMLPPPPPIPPTPVMNYSPYNMTPLMNNTAISLNQIPLPMIPTSSAPGSIMNGSGLGGPVLRDNASGSFRFSQPNLTQTRNSHLPRPSTPSIYSEGGGSVHSSSIALANNGGYFVPSNYNNSSGNVSGRIILPDSNGNFPSDEEIRQEVQRITATADLMTVTKKQVREQLSRYFGVNMAHKKDYINYCIEEALNF
ncbi:chitin synthase-domain-containing protein [Mycotypha africana]|uniref:chitin synthase-domain-containing protein n=1 Tax=Mycotypha africana TaxID=64632 RepID=UPI00230151F2|nr:chitin synthase-domain-containing protein [Mycotypha africana]KAI8988154.1 chitin synthase-domain-containing protein [Mycotypha africana]